MKVIFLCILYDFAYNTETVSWADITVSAEYSAGTEYSAENEYSVIFSCRIFVFGRKSKMLFRSYSSRGVRTRLPVCRQAATTGRLIGCSQIDSQLALIINVSTSLCLLS